MNLELNNKLHGFVLEQIKDIEDAKGTLYMFRHEQTNAELCWLKRDDNNKTFAITFKTIFVILGVLGRTFVVLALRLCVLSPPLLLLLKTLKRL